MSIVLFEDSRVSQLYPITVGRPAFAITCGSYRLIDLAAELDHRVSWVIRPHLREVVARDYASLVQYNDGGTDGGPLLLVNASVVPSANVYRQLSMLVRKGKPGVVRTGERVAAALLAADGPALPPPDQIAEVESFINCLALTPLSYDLPVFSYPHDVVDHHTRVLDENLQRRLERGSYTELRDGVFGHESTRLGEYIVTDTSDGPIILDENTEIGPFCLLSGPAFIGANARVIEHSAIKHGTSLGHTTKIGGEVEASIIEPYTNKQHHGFLGHSYLGSWINLGAGTCNSDLKNTYGTVKMEYNGEKVSTGMQFIGTIAGDYAKTAINTSIFTGKLIGACSMLYGFVTTNVPSFVNYARLFGQVTETPVEVMVATQARMFERRGVAQQACDMELLHAMYELTRHERQIAGEPLSL
jgi:UDP-N-acetylglucosamine diphosphorylase/glucosamine-1-phosphate N-acetyltransferase